MSLITTSKQGAAVTRRFARKNPTQTLSEIIGSAKEADHAKWFPKWFAALGLDTVVSTLGQAEADTIEALAQYFYTNNAHTILRQNRGMLVRADNTKTRKLFEQRANLITFATVLPSGKLLGDATAKEIVAAGAAFTAVGKLATKVLKPNQKARDGLTEAQLAKLK